MSNDRYIGLPPDLVVDPGSWTAAAPSPWNIPPELFHPIWERGITGRGIRVAILDTGVADHPDLPKPIASKDFTGKGNVEDGNGHGTHCAGSVLGRNGIGAAPEAELIVGKVLSDGGSGGTDGINAGIRWAADQGAHIISMSLGGPGPASEEDRAALAYAIGKGCVIFAAAGNAGYRGSNTIGYPGRYDEVICVGAYRQDGTIANFSSGGKEIDIANPGENILSCNYRGGYVAMSGTSMATPNAAGRAALYLQYTQGRGLMLPRGSEQWKAIYRQFARDAGAPGEDPRFGIGIPMDREMLTSLTDTTWV